MGRTVFLFSSASRPALGPTQPPTQWVPVAHSQRPGMKLTTHLLLMPKSKNAWSYTYTHPIAFMTWCLFKHRDNFTFTLTTRSLLSGIFKATNVINLYGCLELCPAGPMILCDTQQHWKHLWVRNSNSIFNQPLHLSVYHSALLSVSFSACGVVISHDVYVLVW